MTDYRELPNAPPDPIDPAEWDAIIADAENQHGGGIEGFGPAFTSPGDDESSARDSWIHWPTFWARDHEAEQWIAEPLLAEGRSHAIVAKAKDGKSLLMLSVAAALATGRPVLDQPAGPPRTVVYQDLEMTEDDVRERLEAFGYGPADDLSRLHYNVMPRLLPLNTNAGGVDLLTKCQRLGAELVILDTFSRTVDTEENAADGVNDYVRNTGNRLKAAGITTVRLDHLGKDTSRGARGSSAKVGDVDVQWVLKAQDSGIVLEATSRLGWVPDKINIELHDNDDGTISHRSAAAVWPKGTEATAVALDQLDVPVEAPVNQAQRALREDDHGRRRNIVSAAQKWRRLEGRERQEPGREP